MEINNVAVRLTAEPDELRTTPSGKQVVSFSAAYNWRTRTDGGFTDVETTFFRCTLWGEDGNDALNGENRTGRSAPSARRCVSATTQRR